MEEWRDVVWYEWLYQVSDLWSVKSIKWWKRNTWKEKLLKNGNICWYNTVGLCIHWKRKQYLVHRLVAQAFLWLDITDTKLFACHKNDVRDDNRVVNLFLWSCSDNLQDMVKKWRHNSQWKFWKLHHNSKIVYQYDKQWNFIKKWYWWREINRVLWFNPSYISAVCLWKRKTGYWFIWKYK